MASGHLVPTPPATPRNVSQPIVAGASALGPPDCAAPVLWFPGADPVCAAPPHAASSSADAPAPDTVGARRLLTTVLRPSSTRSIVCSLPRGRAQSPATPAGQPPPR